MAAIWLSMAEEMHSPEVSRKAPNFDWDKEGILIVDYLQMHETANVEYFCNILCLLKETLNILLFLQKKKYIHLES